MDNKVKLMEMFLISIGEAEKSVTDPSVKLYITMAKSMLSTAIENAKKEEKKGTPEEKKEENRGGDLLPHLAHLMNMMSQPRPTPVARFVPTPKEQTVRQEASDVPSSAATNGITDFLQRSAAQQVPSVIPVVTPQPTTGIAALLERVRQNAPVPVHSMAEQDEIERYIRKIMRLVITDADQRESCIETLVNCVSSPSRVWTGFKSTSEAETVLSFLFPDLSTNTLQKLSCLLQAPLL